MGTKGYRMNDIEDAVMTVQEVSQYLRLAESTIYKLAQEGKLPGRKIGGRWRFSRESLQRWLEKTDVNVSTKGNASYHWQTE
jgi:excisionase family DNA binding protein